MRLDLILTMRDIYINSNLNPLTKFTSSSRSTEFKDILPWNISQIITKIVPTSKIIVISYVLFIFLEVTGEKLVEGGHFPILNRVKK